jgi:hypothetical protein
MRRRCSKWRGNAQSGSAARPDLMRLDDAHLDRLLDVLVGVVVDRVLAPERREREEGAVGLKAASGEAGTTPGAFSNNDADGERRDVYTARADRATSD